MKTVLLRIVAAKLPAGALPAPHFRSRPLSRKANFMFARIAAFYDRMQWPHWLALFLCVGTALIWFAIARLDAAGAKIAANEPVISNVQRVVAPDAAFAFGQAPLAPPEDQFLADLKVLYKIAKANGVSVGTVVYKREPGVSPAIISRQVEIHISDNYPHMKECIAAVLAELPNAVLQELRIERNDALSPQASIFVRLSFFYEVSGSTVVTHP